MSERPPPKKPGAGPGNAFSPLERGAWGGLLSLQSRLMGAVEEDLMVNSMISHPEFEVLLRLSWSDDGQARIQHLAEQSLLTQSGMSRVVERLERKGLVSRSRASDDRRGVDAKLTDKGAERLASAADHHLDFVREHFLSRFSDAELSTLGELLARANEAMSEQSGSRDEKV